jgi:phosphotransferase system HPr (HPr) family protein
MSQPAKTRSVVVTDPAGVHLRTAVAIAEVVRRGKSQVTLIKDGQRSPGSETLQIATMAAEPGATVQIEAIGPDAQAVLDELEPLFAGQYPGEAEKSG